MPFFVKEILCARRGTSFGRIMSTTLQNQQVSVEGLSYFDMSEL